ncbi:hypothetical protein OAO55_01520 [Bacteroidales bacterium]|nr:hypothetical protein [Bacteroidales bacterium]
MKLFIAKAAAYIILLMFVILVEAEELIYVDDNIEKYNCTD